MSSSDPRRYEGLCVTALNPEQHKQTCGYWYTVTAGAMAHTAFATRQGLDRWLAERRLTLESELPAGGEWGFSSIVGSYRQCSHLDLDEFAAIRPVVVTAVMDNADYVLGLIDETPDGERTVHHLNPNVPRLVFDYQSTREMMS